MPQEFHWDIYRDQLLPRGHGHALWEPDPADGRAPVEVGDVGYLHLGRFLRLFNIHLPPYHAVQSRRLPDHFEPLPLNREDITTRVLRRGAYSSKSVRTLNAGVQTTDAISIHANLSFRCSRQKGAVLVLNHDAYREDALHLGAYRRYMLQNISRWTALAQDQEGIRTQDILLVTGRDLTSTWAVAAFTHNEVEAGIDIVVGAPGMPSAGLNANIAWTNDQYVESHWGPQDPIVEPSISEVGHQISSSSTTETSPSSRHGANTQCVFIRTFRVEKRIIFPDKIIANADPVDLVQHRDDLEELPVLAGQSLSRFGDGLKGAPEIRASSDDGQSAEDSNLHEWFVQREPDDSGYEDLVSHAMSYIFETTDADLAIVHDSDISPYLEDFVGDGMAFKERLSRLCPEITVTEDNSYRADESEKGISTYRCATFKKTAARGETSVSVPLASEQSPTSSTLRTGIPINVSIPLASDQSPTSSTLRAGMSVGVSPETVPQAESSTPGAALSSWTKGVIGDSHPTATTGGGVGSAFDLDRDYVRELNNYMQARGSTHLMQWGFGQDGIPHQATHHAHLYYNGAHIATGTTTFKDGAKQIASWKALATWGIL